MPKMIHVSSVDGVTAGFKNKIINGNFNFWQRGTSFSATSTPKYTADRWQLGCSSGSGTIAKYDTIKADGATVNDYVGYSSGRSIALVAGTSMVGGYLLQPIEGVETLAGKTVTLSFYYNPVSGANTATMPYVRQFFGLGGNPSPTVDIAYSTTTHTSYPTSAGVKRISMTFNLPSVNGKIAGTGYDALSVVIPIVGTFSFSIWGVQLEEGSIATDFEMRHTAQELALCQRYYEKSFNIDVTPSNSGTGTAFSTAVGVCGLALWNGTSCSVSFKVDKRTAPTITLYGNSSGYWFVGGAWTTVYMSGSSKGSFAINQQYSSAVTVASGHWTADAEL